MKKVLHNIKSYLNQYPKQTYFIGMAIIIVCFIGSMIKDIWFSPPQDELLIKPKKTVVRVSRLDQQRAIYQRKNDQVERIAKQMQFYLEKQKRQPLTAQDSAQMSQLIKQYENLK